jgi:hypothetical protein
MSRIVYRATPERKDHGDIQRGILEMLNTEKKRMSQNSAQKTAACTEDADSDDMEFSRHLEPLRLQMGRIEPLKKCRFSNILLMHKPHSSSELVNFEPVETDIGEEESGVVVGESLASLMKDVEILKERDRKDSLVPIMEEFEESSRDLSHPDRVEKELSFMEGEIANEREFFEEVKKLKEQIKVDQRVISDVLNSSDIVDYESQRRVDVSPTLLKGKSFDFQVAHSKPSQRPPKSTSQNPLVQPIQLDYNLLMQGVSRIVKTKKPSSKEIIIEYSSASSSTNTHPTNSPKASTSVKASTLKLSTSNQNISASKLSKLDSGVDYSVAYSMASYDPNEALKSRLNSDSELDSKSRLTHGASLLNSNKKLPINQKDNKFLGVALLQHHNIKPRKRRLSKRESFQSFQTPSLTVWTEDSFDPNDIATAMAEEEEKPPSVNSVEERLAKMRTLKIVDNFAAGAAGGPKTPQAFLGRRKVCF